MIHIHKPNDGPDGFELEQVGVLTVDGEIEEVSDGHEGTMNRCAEDLQQLSVEEFLELYGGPNCVAVDMRNPKALPEEEAERLRERKARVDLHNRADDAGVVKRDTGLQGMIEPEEAMQLLDSHANPFPIEKVMDVVNDVWSLDEIAEMEKACESDAERRRFIADSEDGLQIIKSVQARLD